MEKISTFAERFSEALRLRNISAAEMSRQSGVSEGVLSQYKKSLYEPKADRLGTFAKKLNVSAAWLAGYESPMDLEERNKILLDKAKQIGDRLNRSRDAAFPFGDFRRIEIPDESGFAKCRLSEDEIDIIGAYWQLNNAGKEEALKRIMELGKIDTYAQPKE